MTKIKTFIFFLIPLFLIGCRSETTDLSLPKYQLPIRSFQGYKIPQFPTARDQLNHANFGFPDPLEKKAALTFVSYLFPESREECGTAALILAYLNLGYNYQFAEQKDYIHAIQAYNDVINNYKEFPQIIMKAYWYLGWIYCDLLQDKAAGIQYFKKIVSTFPDIEIQGPSPVQWVYLSNPLIFQEPPPRNTIKKKWAEISLLEIIRNSPTETDIMESFDLLWNNYQTSISTGLSIKYLLSDQRYTKKIQPYVQPYLSLNVANPYLAKEIKNYAGIK